MDDQRVYAVEDVITDAAIAYASGRITNFEQVAREALAVADAAQQGTSAMTTNAREEAAALPQTEFDALMDHIYEHGTMAEGITKRARAMCVAYARAVLAAADAARPLAVQAVGAVPAGVKVMTTWRNRNTGSEGLYEAGSMPTVDETHPDYDCSLAFLIPASDAQWAMRHLDSLRDRVGGPALQSLDCVRSWLNAWRATPSPAQQQPDTAPNLSCPSVQARLAAQWGYVKPAQGSLSTPVAQRPEPTQQSAHEAGEAEAAPQERQVSNLRQPADSPTAAAHGLASVSGADSVCKPAQGVSDERAAFEAWYSPDVPLQYAGGSYKYLGAYDSERQRAVGAAQPGLDGQKTRQELVCVLQSHGVRGWRLPGLVDALIAHGYRTAIQQPAPEAAKGVPEGWRISWGRSGLIGIETPSLGSFIAKPDSVAPNQSLAERILFALCDAMLPVAPPAPEAQGEATEFCWLVELFDPNTDNSLGYYHTGFTDLAGESRSTKDPLKAQRYGSKEAASRAAFRLKFNRVGVWRAVEHGFMSRTAPAPQPVAGGVPDGLPVEQEPKYTVNGSHIVNRASGEVIPHDEPVFILRARDVHAMHALRDYCMRLPLGSEHQKAVSARVMDFFDFKAANLGRMKEPDTALDAAKADWIAMCAAQRREGGGNAD